MPRGRPGRIRATPLAAALAVALVAAGCGGGGNGGDGTDADPGGTTATSTTTTAPPPTVDERTQKEEAAKAAYLAFYDAYEEATSEPVDPQHAELQALITSDHRHVVTRNLEDRLARGEAARLPIDSQSEHEIRSLELQNDGSVKVIDCEVDDAVVYEVANGRVIDDETVTNLVMGTVVEEDGKWKVAFTEVVESWPGVVRCPD